LIEIGVEVAELDALEALLGQAYRVEEGGFAQLGDIEDLSQRAVVSDQIFTAAQAIATNLIGARVHLLDFEEMTAAGRREARETEQILNDARVGLHVVGFFRAFASALDCLAAAAVGILRVPGSIHRASMGTLFKVDPRSVEEGQQRELLEEMQELVRDADSTPVEGWMEWAIAYRNALVHRPRQTDFLVQRPTRTMVILDNPAEWMDVARYDLHLRSKPWLPDFQHLATPGPRAEELLLAETARETIAGLFGQLNAFSERFGSWLRNTWERFESNELNVRAPVDSWDAEPDIDNTFSGFTHATLNAGELLRGHPLTTMRLELAERVRRERGG